MTSEVDQDGKCSPVGAVSVVLIEDHPSTSAGLLACLRECSGIEVLGGAATLADGLRLLTQTKPKVVLLDLHLPDSPGAQATVQKVAQSTPDSKVIVFTAESRPVLVEAAIEAGACGYLLKSESPESVADAIKRVVADSRLVLSQDLNLNEHGLTVTLKSILKLLAKGLKYDEIADMRGTTVSTIRKQCNLLEMRVGVANREELIAWAAKNGFADVD